MLSRHAGLNTADRLLRFGRHDEGAPTAPWTPAALSGLLGWYEARRLTVGVGSPVALWPDLSGNDNDLVQPTTSARPTLITSGGGGGGGFAVSLDGADDFLECGTLTGAALREQGFMAVRFAPQSVSFYGTPVSCQDAGPAICRHGTDAEYGICRPGYDGPEFLQTAATGEDVSLVAVWTGYGASCSVYKAGASVQTGAYVGGLFNSYYPLAVGRHYSSGVFETADIRAVAVGSIAPVSSDVTSLLAYLEGLP